MVEVILENQDLSRVLCLGCSRVDEVRNEEQSFVETLAACIIGITRGCRAPRYNKPSVMSSRNAAEQAQEQANHRLCPMDIMIAVVERTMHHQEARINFLRNQVRQDLKAKIEGAALFASVAAWQAADRQRRSALRRVQSCDTIIETWRL